MFRTVLQRRGKFICYQYKKKSYITEKILQFDSEYFDGADIKISHRYAQPYVYNPTSCGQAGENILLPYNFFNENTTGEFGRSGKALLTQFVRLRYGAW